MLRFLAYLLMLSLIFACKGGGKKDPCAVEFDQLGLLSNIGNNIILPRYDSLAAEVNKLSVWTANFSNNPTLALLDSLRYSYWQASLHYQSAAIFEFGPAETYGLRASLGNFPVFVGRLEDAVRLANYNLDDPMYSYTRGFAALDYLLYGTGADANEVLAKFSTDSLAANRRQFLLDVVTQIKAKVDAVVFEWSPAGANYINIFVSTKGLSTGSPISLLINQLNQNYELFKNNKIGTPVGAKNSYIPAPDKVEAYYSQRSLDLAIRTLRASYEVYEGKGGLGLDDYLAAAKIDKDGQALEALIDSRFKELLDNLEAYQTSSMVVAMQQNFNAMKTTFAKAQNMVVLLKTDLPSVLCVSITYADNTDDGD